MTNHNIIINTILIPLCLRVQLLNPSLMKLLEWLLAKPSKSVGRAVHLKEVINQAILKRESRNLLWTPVLDNPCKISLLRIISNVCAKIIYDMAEMSIRTVTNNWHLHSQLQCLQYGGN